jgi:hypothetical protein
LVGEITNVSNFRILSKVLVKHVGDGQFTVEGEHWGNERDDGGASGHTTFGPNPIALSGNYTLTTYNLIHRSEKFRVYTLASLVATGGSGGLIKVPAGFLPVDPPPPVVLEIKGEIDANILVEFTVTDHNPNN